jgi:hypothetical protein
LLTSEDYSRRTTTPLNPFFSNGSDLPVADNAVFSTVIARPGFVESNSAPQKDHGLAVNESTVVNGR